MINEKHDGKHLRPTLVRASRSFLLLDFHGWSKFQVLDRKFSLHTDLVGVAKINLDIQRILSNADEYFTTEALLVYGDMKDEIHDSERYIFSRITKHDEEDKRF